MMRGIGPARRPRALAVLLLLTSIAAALAHSTGAVPAPGPPENPTAAPTVIATSPASETVAIPLDATIEVWFSEPMNESTVGFAIQPLVGLTPSWPSGDHLVLRPNPPGLANCTVYRVQVAGQDLDEGLALSPGGVPNPWSFMTVCDRPFVVGTLPADGARNVPAGAEIVIRHSEPMDPLVVSLRLFPSPTSMITSWDASRTVLTARMRLEPGTTYAATASGRDVDGNPLVPSFVTNPWTFTVNEPPVITDFSLSASGCLDSGSALTISWTMADDLEPPSDLTVSLEYLSGTAWEPLTGARRGFPSPASYVWTLPAVDLPTRVRLGVNDSAGGVAQNESAPFRIDTGPPRVFLTSPTDGATGVPIGDTVFIVFSEPMNRTSVEAAISSDPPLTGATPYWSLSGDVLTLAPAGLRDRTTYRITVAASAADTCGAGKAMGAPHTFAFATGSAPPVPPAGLRAPSFDASSVSLEWDSVTAFVTGTPIPPDVVVVYHVYRSDRETDVGVFVAQTVATRVTDTGLQPSTTYVYRVLAVVDGLPSDLTPSLTVRTRDPFLATPLGWALVAAVVATAAAIGMYPLRRTRRRAAARRAEAEVREIADDLLRAREEPDPEERRMGAERAESRLLDTLSPGGARPRDLFRALAEGLVQPPAVDLERGGQIVEARLGALSAKLRRYGDAHRFLSAAEAGTDSEMFAALPRIAQRAVLFLYVLALEEYLDQRLRGLLPSRLAPRPRRRAGGRWAAGSVGDLVSLAERHREAVVANVARWREAVPRLHRTEEAGLRCLDISQEPPTLAEVRALVYTSLEGCKGVFRRKP